MNEPPFDSLHRSSRRRRIAYAGAALLIAGSLGVGWHTISTSCSISSPQSCDYNERYELMRKHPELGGSVSTPLDESTRIALEQAIKAGRPLPPWFQTLPPGLQAELKSLKDLQTYPGTR